jgi:hypothetical protein
MGATERSDLNPLQQHLNLMTWLRQDAVPMTLPRQRKGAGQRVVCALFEIALFCT